MNRRGILTTIGATALGAGIIIGGTTMPTAFAQESTSPQVPVTEQTTAPDERFVEAYDDFVAALASDLNADEAAVDAAIRAALKEQIAAQQAAGNLDAEQATELQAMIDEAEAPLPVGFGGRGRMHAFGGHDGGFRGRGDHRGPKSTFEGHGPRDGFDGRGGVVPGSPAGDSAPATRPSPDDATGQSTPAIPVSVQPGATI